MAKKAMIGATINLDGEKEFRQAITGINSGMKVLQSEMKSVSTAFADNANSIEALTKKDTLLIDQVDKQKEKVEALNLALENSKKQYGENDTRTDKWKISLNNAEAELSKLDRELNKNNTYLDEAKHSTDKCATSIDKFGKEMKTAGDHTLKTGDVIKANLTSAAIVGGVVALGNAAQTAATKIVDLATGAATYADDMLTLSTQTGISTDKLQAYNYAAELVDVSTETMTKSMAKNIKSMSNAQKGSESYVNAFKALNVEFQDGNKKLLDSEEVYWNVIDALKGIADETERDSISMQLFGKSAQELNPLIDKGSEGIKTLSAEAKSMGAILDSDTLNSLGGTDDALQRMNQSLEIAKLRFGAAFAPAVEESAEKITAKMTEMGSGAADLASGALSGLTDGLIWMIDNSDLVAAGLSGIGSAMITSAAASVVKEVAVGFQALTVATEGATVAQSAFNFAQKANLIGLAATAAIGLTAALGVYVATSEKAKDETDKFIDGIRELRKENETLNTSINNNIDSRNDELESIESQYGSIQKLSDELYDLADNENKSNAAKAQMSALVNQLNEALPDLNLTIDTESGLLNMQKGEVDGLILANLELYKVKAAQADLTKIAEDQYNAEKALNDSINQRKDAQTKLSSIEAEYNALKEEGLALTSGATQEEKARSLQAIELSGEMSSLQKEIEGYDKDVKKTNTTISDLGVQWNETKGYIGDHSDVDDAAKSVDEFGNAVETSTDTAATSLSGLKDAYKDAKKTAKDSIQSQIDIFGELKTKSEDDLEAMSDTLLTNLTNQAKNTQTWADNLDKLGSDGIGKGLLKHLREMGPGAADEIAALTKLSGDELKEYEKQWEKLGKASADAAEDSVKGLKKQWKEAEKASKQSITDSTTAMNKQIQIEIPEVAKNLALGFAGGITGNTGLAVAAAAALAEDALTAMKNQLVVQSPSKRAKKEVGEQLAQGVINGVNEKKSNAKKSASELAEIMLEAAGKKLENYKVYHDMSLEEEVAYWDKIRKATKKGTQSRIDADKEYFEVKKSLADEEAEILEKQTEAQKDYADNVKKVNEDLATDIEDIQNDSKEKRADLLDQQYELEKEYAINCEKVNYELEKSIDDLNDKYNNSVASRTEAIAKSMGLFDEYAKNSSNKKDLIFALETQVGGLEDWTDGLDNLRTRGVDTGLVEELQDLGVKSAGEIEAINSMTDEELTKYVNLWKDKNALAKSEALTELEGLRLDTEKEISTLNGEASFKLKEYQDKLKEDTAKLTADLKQLYADEEKQIAKLRADSAQEIAAYAQTYTETLSALIPEVEEIGGGIADGIIKGIKSRKSAVNQEMASLVSDSIEAAKKAGEINSPSKKSARLIGSPLGQGVAVGIGDQADLVNNAMSSLTDFSVGSVNMGSLSMPNVSGLTNNTVSNRNVVNLTINTQSLTETELDMTFNYINRRLGDSVG